MKTVSEQRENVLSEFEGRFGFSIPASLREVILGVPCELGRSFVGSDTGLGCLQEINEWAREIVLSDARPDVLKKSDFVFIMHGGYIFYYVPCDEGSDPPVYIYYEGKKSSPQLEGDSFTAWFWGEETDRKSRKKWYQFNWLRKSSRT